VPACTFGRAEAAALLAEGKDDEAQRRIAEAESALSEHPAPGTAIAERAWLRDLATTVYLTDDAHSPERPDQREGAQHERRHKQKT
jgi:hypothetical protein